MLLFVTLNPSRLSVDTHTRLRPVPKRHLFSGRKLLLRLNSALAAVSKAQCCPTTFIFVLPHRPHFMSPNDTLLPDFPSSMSWPHQCPVSTSLPLLRCMRSIDYRFTGRLNSFECGQVSIVPIYSLHINITYRRIDTLSNHFLSLWLCRWVLQKQFSFKSPVWIHFNV